MTLLIIMLNSFFLFLYKMLLKVVPLHLKTFNLTWLIYMLTVHFNLLNLVQIKNEVYIMVILFIISYNLIGLLLIKKTRKVSLTLLNIRIPERILIFIELFVSFVLLIFISRVFKYILVGDLNTIRRLIYFKNIGVYNDLFKNGIEVIVVQWLIQGIIIFLFYISTLGLLLGGIKKYIIFWSYINVVLFSILTSSRMIILNILILLLIIISLNFRQMNVNYNFYKIINKNKKYLIFISFILVLIVSSISILRKDLISGISEIIETIFLYLNAPLFYFSTLLDYFNVKSSYGLHSISGLLEIFSLVIDNIFSINLRTPLRELTKINQIYINLGTSKVYFYNAITTIFLPIYLDFKIFGGVIYGIILSIISNKLYMKTLYKRSVLSIFNYSFINYIIIMSFISWELLYPHIWIFYMLGLTFNYFFINKKVNL